MGILQSKFVDINNVLVDLNNKSSESMVALGDNTLIKLNIDVLKSLIFEDENFVDVYMLINTKSIKPEKITNDKKNMWSFNNINIPMFALSNECELIIYPPPKSVKIKYEYFNLSNETKDKCKYTDLIWGDSILRDGKVY